MNRTHQIFFAVLAAALLLPGCASPLFHPATDERWLLPGHALSAPVGPAPKGRPLRVAVYGDSQGNRTAQRAVLRGIRASRPDLVIFEGDAIGCLPTGHMPDLGPAACLIPVWPQIQRDHPAIGLLTLLPFPALLHELLLSAWYPPRDPDGWNMFLEETAGLRLVDRTPFLFVPGNHDLYHTFDRNEIARFTGAADPHVLWRAVDAGKWRFVLLDSGNDLWGDEDLLAEGGDQLRWLEATLSDAEARGLRSIVSLHYPPFTSVEEDPPLPGSLNRVEPILKKHGVALVLSGHAHVYERIESGPLTHIATGGSGGRFHTLDPERREPGSKSFIPNEWHFVLLELGEKEIRGRMVPVHPVAEPPGAETSDEFVVPLTK